MLRFFSQRSGIQKAILWTFVGILVLGLGVVFALPGGRSMLRSYTPIGASTEVAAVDGYPITLSDLRSQIKVYGQSQKFQSGQFDNTDEPDVDSLYPQYGKQAIDTLVSARLVRREADRLGLGASTQEMRDTISSQFTDPKTGKWVGQQEYQTRLRMNGMSVEEYERDVADQLTETKLRNFLTSGLSVSDREIEDDYRRSTTSMKPTYVLVAPKPDDGAAPTDDELRAFYEAHKGDFRINQTQRKVTYLFVDQAALGKTLTVSDDDLKADYEQNKAQYVSAVHVQQIVFKVADPTKDADVRKKAEDIANRARPSGDKPAEDFAELAKANSEDVATAANGGDAGDIDKASLKPGDPRERLFTLDPGQTTAALKVGDSYIIYKVGEKKTKSFEESREDLLKAARDRKAYSRGVEVAQQAADALKSAKDAKKAADTVNTAVGAAADAPVVTVRETPYVQPGDQIPDIGSNAQFDAEVSGLANVGDVGDTVGVTGGFAVPMLAEKREPHDATFDEVRDRVAASFKQDRAKQKARAIAQQLADGSATPDELREKSKAAGYDAKTQESYKAGGTLPDMTQASDLLDSVLLGLPANSVSKTPVEMPNGFVVLAEGARTEPDMGAAFDGQKDSIRTRLLSTKQGQLYTEYMKNLRKQLEESKQIVIYQDTIDRAFAIGGGADDEGDDDDSTVPTLPSAGTPKGPSGRPGAPAGLPPGMTPPPGMVPPGMTPTGAQPGAPPDLKLPTPAGKTPPAAPGKTPPAPAKKAPPAEKKP